MTTSVLLRTHKIRRLYHNKWPVYIQHTMTLLQDQSKQLELREILYSCSYVYYTLYYETILLYHFLLLVDWALKINYLI